MYLVYATRTYGAAPQAGLHSTVRMPARSRLKRPLSPHSAPDTATKVVPAAPAIAPPVTAQQPTSQPATTTAKFARSRLQKLPRSTTAKNWLGLHTAKQFQNTAVPIATVFQQAHRFHNTHAELLQTYLQHLYLVIMSTGGYAATLYILTTVRPSQISHIPLPYFYGPLQLAFFLGNAFLFSFIFLHVRRGLLAACFLSLLLFLQLQSVVLTAEVVGGVLALLGTFELLFFLIAKKLRRR
jgi:hypothetical protein